MSYFRYRAIAPTGDFVAREVEVTPRQEVIRRCDRRARATTTLPRSNAFCSRTQWHCEMTAFLRQLSVLVGAGLALEAALQVRGRDTGHTLARLHRHLDGFAGTRVAVALGAGSVWNWPWARAMISTARASLRGTTGRPDERCAPRAIGVRRFLVEKGVPFSTAPKIVRDVVHHAVAAECVHAGGHDRCGFTMRGLRIDDATGALALIARHGAQFYARTFGLGLDRLLGVVAAVATIVVGGKLIVSILGAPLGIRELAT